MSNLTTKMADAIRILAIDAVEKAKSGHPGAPMGMAEMGLVLWRKHLSHSPSNPKWFNRDRFVLSNGHASMFIYSLLHLTGYKSVSIEDIKAFRQLHSKTPGHPENFVTEGIETTTGPLGQGVANAVGMALAEKLLAGEFNKDGMDIVDHNTYCVLGDGCLMEGISHEVCSLAGTLNLSKLTILYDDNDISIDGNVGPWFSEDVKKRFEAYGWNVIGQIDGHNIQMVDNAIADAKKSDKPTLIICKTIIGKGSPNKAGGHGIHGAALGEEEVIATRKNLNWEHPAFEIPSELKSQWDCNSEGKEKEDAWDELFAKYKSAHPKLASEFERRMNDKMPADFKEKMEKALADLPLEKIATRKASQNALDAIAPHLPEIFGGSADLTGSNLTNFANCQKVTKDDMCNYLSYGVREFGMSAIMNGMKLHAGYLPYGGTFLTFCDYSRNAIRMSALMKEKVIHMFTHDSIGLGEDGPTHQSIEHIPSLRIIPNLDVWRPADSLESFVAWRYALENDGTPSALIFSRQGVPVLAKDKALASSIAKGGYVLEDEDNYDIIIIGTGTELSLAVEAKAKLNKQGKKVRVVSMPSTNVFDKQDKKYRKSVIPCGKKVIVVEASKTDVWYKYIRSGGDVVGIDTFGESAPADELYKLYNITTKRVVEVANEILAKSSCSK
jgi:transketolase